MTVSQKQNCIKHGIQVSDEYNFYLSTSIISICLPTGMSVKVTKRQLTVKTIHQGFRQLAPSPKDKKSIAGFRAACAKKRKSTEGESSRAVTKKRKSLTNLNLAEFICERGIRSYNELLAIAEDWRTAGQMDIAEFVFKRNEKALRELVTKTCQMESAKEKLEASKASQIYTVQTHLTFDCVEGCSGQWLQCAKEVLLLNGIDTLQFVTSIKDLLINGRGKNRNFMIT